MQKIGQGLICALLAWAQLSGVRAGEPAVAVVNMEQIFAEHQQLKQIMAQINAQNAKDAAQGQQMAAALEQQQAELRQANLDAQDTTLTEIERSRRAVRLEDKMRDYRSAENKFKRFDEDHRRQLAKQLQDLRQKYYAAIQAEIAAYATEQHIAFVFDSSNVTGQNSVSGLLHADQRYDITAAISARVNQPHPPAAAQTNATHRPQK